MSAYWEECISQSLDEAKVSATPEQIEQIANDVMLAHEMYREAHGHYCIPSPLTEENKTLMKLLHDEREKVHCRTCNGHGRIVQNFGFGSSDAQCWTCHGEGKHKP